MEQEQKKKKVKRHLSNDGFKIEFRPENTRVFRNKNAVIAKVCGRVEVPRYHSPFKEFDQYYAIPVAIDPFYVETSGVAILRDGDTFDMEKGSKIAIAKAESEAYRKAASIIKIYMKSLDEFLEKKDAFLNKCQNVIEHNKEFLKKMSE